MTGYTVHTGTSEAFASGWDRIFSKESGTKAKGTPKPGKPATAKSARKTAKAQPGKSRRKG